MTRARREGDGRHDRWIASRRPAFDLPPAPAGWDESGRPLIRIVDPSGEAVAWLAPDFDATCVGFVVRRAGALGDGWTPVFRPAELPPAFVRRRVHGGCRVLVALPDRPSPTESTARAPAMTPRRRWRLIERDPTAVVHETQVTVRTTDADGQPGPGLLRLRLAARLDDGILSLELAARNESLQAAAVGLGFRPTFASRTANGLPAPDRGGRIGISLDAGIRHQVVQALRSRPGFSIALLGYAPGRGLAHLPPGGRTRIAVSIGGFGEAATGANG